MAGGTRRWARRLFTAAAAASLLLCVLCVGLWGRQRWESDEWFDRRTGPAPTATTASHRAEWHLWNCTSGLVLEAHAEDVGVGAPVDTANWGKGYWADGCRWDVEPPRQWVPIHGAASGIKLVQHLPPLLAEYGVRAETYSWRWPRGQQSTWRGSMWAVTVPPLLPCALLAVVPIAWEVRYRRALGRLLRARRGLCRACGYDLRASAGRCPECGAATA